MKAEPLAAERQRQVTQSRGDGNTNLGGERRIDPSW